MQKLFEYDQHIGDWRVLVQTRDIANGAIKSRHIVDDAVTTEKIGDGEVKSRNIAPNAVTTDKIGDGEVKSRNIGEGAVIESKILNDAVTESKIKDSAVTERKIKDDAVTESKIKNGAVTTRKIMDDAVVTEKIGDGEVKTRNIGPGAVTTDKILDGNVTEEKIGNKAVTTPKIAEKAVTREKLDDEAIPELLGVMDEFIAAVRNEIRNFSPISIRGDVTNAPDEEDITAVNGRLKLKDMSGLYGYAMKILRKNKTFAEQVTEMRCVYVVKYDFNLGGATVEMPADSIILFDGGRLTNGTLNGSVHNGIADSNSAGMYGLILCSALYYEYMEGVTLTGEYMDETAHGFQDQINAIVNGKATVGLSATPDTVFVGVQSSISLSATTNTSATSIKIKKGSTELASGSGTSLNGSDTITPSAPGNTAYLAEFTIAGLQKQAPKNVVAVYPVYYGAGLEQSDVLDVAACKASPRTTPTGTYTVQITGGSKYIWFFVPANMSTQITSAKMNGFDFPLETLADVTDASNVVYKVYRTPNTNEAGTYVININPSN